MKGELKAGGLALVISSSDACDIGKCVTLVQLVRPGDQFTAPGGVICHWLPIYPPAWLVTGDVATAGHASSKTYQGWALFPPENLMPIDGDDDQEPEQLAKDKPAELTA